MLQKSENGKKNCNITGRSCPCPTVPPHADEFLQHRQNYKTATTTRAVLLRQHLSLQKKFRNNIHVAEVLFAT
jgi:hypothetical protein